MIKINSYISAYELHDRRTRQESVYEWARYTFGWGIEVSPGVRMMRLVEECTELAQAQGLSLHDVLRVVLAVYDRPVGEVHQEIGGVAVTLMAYCQSRYIELARAEFDEITRINDKDHERFRARAAEKREAKLIPGTLGST